MVLFCRILSVCSMLYVANSYCMQDENKFVFYCGKKYPMIKNQICENFLFLASSQKLIIKLPYKIISKKIKKIDTFCDGFALITKKRKPAAAISCFDLALVSQKNKLGAFHYDNDHNSNYEDFHNEMQKQLDEHNLEHGKLLKIYLGKDKPSFSNLIGLIARNKNMINYVKCSDVKESFLGQIEYYKCSGLREKKGVEMLGIIGMDLIDGLFEEDISLQYVNLIQHFSLQIGENMTFGLGKKLDYALQIDDILSFELEKESNYRKYGRICILGRNHDDYNVIEALDCLLGKIPYRIIAFLENYENSTFRDFPREILIYIAQYFTELSMNFQSSVLPLDFGRIRA